MKLFDQEVEVPRSFLLRAAGAFLSCVALWAWPAAAQEYPARPVRLITPYGAGGGVDAVTRLIAQKLSEAWGQPVVVDNRPGAGSTIGTLAAVRSAPDGYTLLLGANPLAIAPAVYPELPYDPRRDLVHINLIATSPQVLVVNPASGISSVADLLAHARKAPQRLNFGSAGIGTLSHLASEDLSRRAGLNAVHIAFRGGALPLMDLMAGRLDYAMDGVAAVQPHVKAGKLRALAVAAPQRTPQLPAVPTFAEAGVPNMEFLIWVALAAPAGTPESVVRRIDDTLREVLRDPALRNTMAAQGWDAPSTSRADYARFLEAEMAKLGAAARAAGVKPE